MSQYLPTGGFEWVDLQTECPEYWTQFIQGQQDEQEEGYMVEVDLEYPKELHDNHDTFPLAPEHLDIKKEMLSSYQNELAEELGVKVGGEKLCLTLDDKRKYICHYRNVKLYLEKGMKITKVHRILKFNQSPWLAEYIELNTNLRKNASNDFEKDFFKLMNNSFFGKVSFIISR